MVRHRPWEQNQRWRLREACHGDQGSRRQGKRFIGERERDQRLQRRETREEKVARAQLAEQGRRSAMAEITQAKSSAVRRVRKAVLPAAGLGTRFLPATKAQPKEMLTVVDKPQIQYVVEECVVSGIEHIII